MLSVATLRCIFQVVIFNYVRDRDKFNEVGRARVRSLTRGACFLRYLRVFTFNKV